MDINIWYVLYVDCARVSYIRTYIGSCDVHLFTQPNRENWYIYIIDTSILFAHRSKHQQSNINGCHSETNKKKLEWKWIKYYYLIYYYFICFFLLLHCWMHGISINTHIYTGEGTMKIYYRYYYYFIWLYRVHHTKANCLHFSTV